MGKYAREYTTCFARAQSFVEAAAEYAHLTSRARHRQAVDLAKLAAFGMASAYVGATAGTKLVYDVLLKDYEFAARELAMKPEQSAAEVLPSRGSLSKEEREFLTQINDCMAICFVCRYPDCGYYGRNDQWVKNTHHHWCRCPRCTKQYQPSRDKAGKAKTITLSKLQKVVLLRHPFNRK